MNRFQHAESFGIKSSTADAKLRPARVKGRGKPHSDYAKRPTPNKKQSKKLDARVRNWQQGRNKDATTCPGSLNPRKQA